MSELVDECFQAIGIKDTKIVSARRLPQKHEVSVILGNVHDKMKILHSQKTHPVTFEIEEVDQKSQSSVDKFYSNYCKYT